MIGCKNSTLSTTSNNSTTSSTLSDKKQITDTELAEEKSLPEQSKNKTDFPIPTGHKQFEKIEGDLNKDGLNDVVIITKGKEKEKMVINRFEKEVDRNRRGIMIFLSKKNDTYLATNNLSCFSSENEDGGVYYPPQLSIDIEDGKLYVNYHHGRYGYWKYTFRYQNSDFELIGYDSSSNYGPIVNRETSINFITKKKLTKENVNQDTENSGDEIFEETWEEIAVNKLYRLSEITDFDVLDVN